MMTHAGGLDTVKKDIKYMSAHEYATRNSIQAFPATTGSMDTALVSFSHSY
jgi:hypothetical protein